MTNYWFTAYQN